MARPGPARAGKIGGYSESQMSPTRFEVYAAANGPADRFAPTMALYRAAELTLEKGYSYFLVTNSRGSETMVGYGSPTSFAGDNVRLVIEFQNDATVPPAFVGQTARAFEAASTIARLQPEIDARQ